MVKVKVLMVAEIELDDADIWQTRARERLDAFRESVQPSSEHGITLTTATAEDMAEFAGRQALFRLPGFLLDNSG